MGGRKVTVTFDEDQLKVLSAETKRLGLGRISTLVKHLATVGLAVPDETGARTMLVRVAKWQELNEYVQQKGLGSIETFAVFAMEQYTSRYPVSEAKKSRRG
jgi:hypothetical protein